GTHVARTGDIGICKIVYEGSISAGVRRIEAITGEGALARFQEDEAQVKRFSGIDPEKLQEQIKTLEHENQQLKIQRAQDKARELVSEAKPVKSVKVVAKYVPNVDRPQLRAMVDDLRNRLGDSVVVLGTSTAGDSSVSIVGGVSKGLTGKVH